MKKVKKCYVVEKYLTDEECPPLYILGIYSTSEKAIEATRTAVKELNSWVDDLPIPLDFFIEHINELDMRDDHHYPFHFFWKNYLGYTEKDWQETYCLYYRRSYLGRLSVSVSERYMDEYTEEWGERFFTEIIEPIEKIKGLESR